MGIWKNYDVDENKEYYVALLQESSGRRSYELCEKGMNPKSKYAVLRTKYVPYELLFRRDLEAIGSSVGLTNDEVFYIDPHGIWLTETEALALQTDEEIEVPWLNGIPAVFPSR